MDRTNNHSSVIIGLPARNEGANILECLESIREAVLYLGRPGIKVVVCVNGCTDDTRPKVESFISDHKDVEVCLIESEEGLVEAQRVIVTGYPADVFIFPDADNVIQRDSIKLLLDALNDPSAVVAYATTSPEPDPENRSLFQRVAVLYDSQRMLTDREYFHGRLFATKDWFVPEAKEILHRAHRTRMGTALLKYSRPGTLLYADDVFMSSYVMDKYGLAAIRQVKGAVCRSRPVGSLRDWWNSYRRRNIEMAKLHCWFPEYDYLSPHINRRTNWRNWLKADLLDKSLWIALLVMKGGFRMLLELELAGVFLGICRPADQWQATLTTKRWKRH